MNLIDNVLKSPIFSVLFLGIFLIGIACILIAILIAIMQGREVQLWKIRIGEKPKHLADNKFDINEYIKNNFESIRDGLSNMSLRRFMP